MLKKLVIPNTNEHTHTDSFGNTSVYGRKYIRQKSLWCPWKNTSKRVYIYMGVYTYICMSPHIQIQKIYIKKEVVVCNSIIVGNKRDDPSLYARRGCLNFTLILYAWERYEFNYSPSCYGYAVEQTALFNTDMTTNIGEEKLWN